MNIDDIISGLNGEDGDDKMVEIIRYLKRKSLPKFSKWLKAQAETKVETEKIIILGLAALTQHVRSEENKTKIFGSLQQVFECLLQICIGVWITQGDSVARRKYISNMKTTAIGTLIKKGCKPEEAEEIFFEGFGKMIDNVSERKFKGQSLPSTYLLSICKYIFYNKIRNERRERPIDPKDLPLDDYTEEDLLNLWKDNKGINEWLMKQIEMMKTNCKEILKDWLNGTTGKEMKDKYKFSSESVVFVRINNCKKHLRKQIFGIAGKKCQKILLAFMDKKQKNGFYYDIYQELAAELNIADGDSMPALIDSCFEKISVNIFK